MFDIIPILGNSQKLDGGAMFGNAPKAMWSQWVDVDSENRIDLACRCFLLKERTGRRRNILLETGVGAFFEPKLKSRFGIVESEHILLHHLQQAGLSHEDIDMVILSHLHFDHAGGLLTAWEEGTESRLLFPHATYVVSEQAWERAQKPHPRDRASFLPELNRRLLSSGRLHFLRGETDEICGPGFRFHYAEGHTPGMVLTEVEHLGRPFVFAADLIPGQAWVHIPITMGYDRFPERVIEEKKALLDDLYARGGGLLFTHDAHLAAVTVERDDRGKFSGRVHTLDSSHLNNEDT